jgi:hypothetical protein
MTFLLDTYNILHVVGVLPPEIAGLDASGLAELLQKSRWRNVACWLICDGTPKGPSEPRTGNVRIHFAGPGVTADEAIAAHIAESSAPRRITVVSNDREVQREARRRRCKVMSAEAFLSQLVQDMDCSKRPVNPPGLPNRTTQEWVEAFGLDDELGVKSSPPLPEPDPAPPPRSDSASDTERTSDSVTPEKSNNDIDAIEHLDMNDLIDEDGNWRGPDS